MEPITSGVVTAVLEEFGRIYTLRGKRLTNTAILPKRTHFDDAGLDLYADEDVEIMFGEVVKIKTGIALAIPPNFYGNILGRSSMASRGLTVLGGVIDSGYRGEVVVMLGWPCDVYEGKQAGYGSLFPTTPEPIKIKRGDKIAQIVITAISLDSVTEVDNLDDTDRGAKGFGSTGGLNEWFGVSNS